MSQKKGAKNESITLENVNMTVIQKEAAGIKRNLEDLVYFESPNTWSLRSVWALFWWT